MKKIIFILLVLFSQKLIAQQLYIRQPVNDSVNKITTANNALLSPKAQLPANFYTSHMPFFCGKELQVQKITGVAVKLRLGSVDYVDRLENKNAAITGLH